MRSTSFNEYVRRREIDTSRIKRLYAKADIAIQIAQEWDEQTNKPPLFSQVNAVVNLDGRNYGLFSSALGKEDKMMILSRGEANKFPTTGVLNKYPQLNTASVLTAYPVMVNVRLILKNSHDDMEAVKRIGGVAVHEATHAQDYTAHSNKPSVSLGEQRPEANRMAFEKWFDQNAARFRSRIGPPTAIHPGQR